MDIRTLIARLARVSTLDWIMLTLALISIGLLAYETWGPVTEAERADILLADTVICAIFAVEFLWRWRAAGWRRDFVIRNWYEILGMIPVSHPAIRGFRLFRIIRIVVLLSRFGMAADRAFGEDFTYRLVNRFRDTLVQSISGAVTVAVLDEVATVLSKGTYTRNISRALAENQTELRAMILEKLKHDAQVGRLARLPFYDDVVRAVIDAGLRVFEQILQDPRTDELVADVLRENLMQLRAAVLEHTAAAEQARQRNAAAPDGTIHGL
ncbi:Ion transport protein [Fontimonas thermophila]|uniref:Ion transport protein n=1 Tax=Fontimonas thermophila TaxID=1076937 RepID=A0A1I2I4N3_9GAMM|nr:ion transporter [Fontimonas thermophila]SFF37124.1 Ion transport protein [Fontimonas thermophila]